MNFCPNTNLPESKALIKQLGLLGFYKHWIQNNYDINEDIADRSVSDLLFVNKDKFTASQQDETIKSLVYQIQTLRKEGLTNVNDIINQIKSDLIETEEYWRTIEDSDEVTEQIANNIKDVLDNYDEFISRTNRELEKSGLNIAGKQIVVEDTSIQTDDNTQESSYDSADGIFQKLNYSDDSNFSQSSKDTASGDIKMALSLIPKYVYTDGKLVVDEDGEPEAELNHLYLPKFEDQGTIWNDLLYTLLDVPIGQKLEYLKNSTNPRHQVIYDEITSNPKTNIQNEFEVVFSKQQAKFTTVDIKKETLKQEYNSKTKKFQNVLDDNGQPIKDGRVISVFDTNRSNANSFLVDNWYESFLQSGIVNRDSEGNQYIDTTIAKQAKEAFDNARELAKTDTPKAIKQIVSILNNLGIIISEKAFKESVRDENGKTITGTQVILSKLPYFFNKLSGNITEQDLEDTLEYNNPFINDTSSITLLAKLENKANPTLFETSFISGDGKSKYSFVNNSYLSLKMRKLKSDDNYLQELRKTPYASKSFWLNQLITNPLFKSVFNVQYIDTLGNDKTNQTNKPFRRMSTKEKEFTRIAMFQNQGRSASEREYIPISQFIGLIPSDKTTIPLFKSLKVPVTGNYKIGFGQDTIEVIYDQFISEYNRIKQTKEQTDNPDIQQIAGYHGKNGAGTKFIVFRFLNKDLIVNNELVELDDIRLAEIVRPEIDKFLSELTAAQIQYWKDNGLYNESIFDKSYKAKKGITSSNIEQSLENFAGDYAINQFVFMMNQTQLISGDPALHGKNDKGIDGKSGPTNIDKTWINFYKRMAKDIAPGLDGNFKNSSYNTIFLKDLVYDTALLNEYNDKVGEIAQSYIGMNPADAQEYTTLQEHLDVMDAYGRLTEEAREAGQRLLDGGTDISDINLILQPMKPVYVNDKIEDNIDKFYYIKTSSFPLIPALTSGLEIDKLRLAMEGNVDENGNSNPIQRAVYESGVKLGLQGEISEISKDGFVKFRELDINSKQIINLDRSGFRIQQELPYHGDASHQSEGSQARKLILNNVEDTDTINYNGNDITGKEAKQIFESLHIEKMNRAFDKFQDDIGYDKTLGRITDLSKIEKILREEATLRNYPINDIYSIQVIEENGVKRFKVPLGFTNNSSRFESILNALVTNRVIKQELPGFAKVQGSGAGFTKIAGFDEANAVVKSGIVWTSPDSTLTYTKDVDGRLTGADILVPSWFKGTDMSQYIKEDGTLDTDKMPEDLLTLVGIRIPTQGYNSMMKFRVKGFLPNYMGDLAIVPSEVVVQMGSDFDVDKLFLYRYHYTKNDEGTFSRLSLDTSDLSKLSNEQLEDGIMQMFVDRLSDVSLLDQMLEPNGFGTLPEVAKNVAKLQKGNKALHTFTTKDQNNIHKLNNDGKAGTGIFSLFSTFNKTAQDAKLSLKVPLKFKNNSGIVVEVGDFYSIRGIENQRKSSVIAYLQSAAVDNAKEQILGKLNINDTTMGVAGTMAMLGLDEAFIGYFLSQPVLIDYVNRIQQANDIITGEFDPSLESKTRESIYRDLLGDQYSLQLVNDISSKLVLGSKELLQFLEQGNDEGLTQLLPEELETIGKANNMFAVKVLTDFLQIKDIADKIRVLQSATNVDTDGLGASFTSLEIKSTQIDNLLIASGKDSYPINNVPYIFTAGFGITKNIIGNSSRVLKETKAIYSQILPQGSVAYQDVIDKVQKAVGLTLTDNNLTDIYRNIKSYVLSSPDIIQDIEKVREELLKGKNTLASRWEKYSNTKEGKRNILTSRIKPRFAKNKGDNNLLTALNTPASNNSIDIDNAMMYFYDMIENGSELEKQLANDLVKYYIVTGAQFGPTSIGKYISYDVLEKNNFSEKLRRIEDTMSQGFVLDGFVDQYFQNNPTKAKSFSLENPKSTFVTMEIPELTIESTGMLAGYFNVYVQKASKFLLYKKGEKTPSGFEYTQIPILANTKESIKNYNMVNTSPSAQTEEQYTTGNYQTIETRQEADITDVIKTKYNFNGGAQNILKAIAEQSNNAYYRKMASDYLSKFNNLGTINVLASNSLPSNGWYGANTISINFSTITENFGEQSSDKFEEVFLHEISHAGTVNQLDKFNRLKATKSNAQMVADGDFTREQILAINGINNLFNEYSKAYPDQEKLAKYIDINNRRRAKQSVSAEEMQFLTDNKQDLYPLTSVKEFIAAGLTSETYINKLKQGGFWSKFIEYIGNLLGVNKTDLDALYNSTISLLDTTSTKSLYESIAFQEEPTSGYRTRTVKNASADATIALATDFSSAGERLTKSSVLNQNKKYIPIDANTLEVTEARVNKIVDTINSIPNKQGDLFGGTTNGFSLNIAGNGIYTMKGKYTQEQVDEFTYQLLKSVLQSPRLNKEITLLRSGGQTGFDEAGIKAGVRLGIPTLALAPKGWTFRDVTGRDINSEEQFKARFANIQEDFNTNQDEINRLKFVAQRNEFLRAYKKQIGSIVTQETLDNIKKYADVNDKYSNLRIWGYPTTGGKFELRVSRKDPEVNEDIADAPVKTEQEIFIDRVINKFRDNLKTLQDRERQLGANAPAELSVRIEKIKNKIADLLEKKDVNTTITAAENKIKEIRKSLSKSTYTPDDLYEYTSYLNMLLTLNQQIEFDEEFKEYTDRLNNIAGEAIILKNRLREAEINTIQSWISQDLDIPFDLKQKLEQGLKDVGTAESGFLDFSQSSSEVIQSLGNLIERAKFEANQKHDEFAEEFTPLLKEYLSKYKNYDMLLQKDKDGKPNGFLLNKYSDEYYKKSKGNFKFYKANVSKTISDENMKQWEVDKKMAYDSMSEEDYFNFLRLNSPIEYLKDWKAGKKSDRALENNSYKYITEKIDDKWIDPNYAKLKALGEEDPAVKFYNFIEGIIRKNSRKYGQQSNYIPEIQKSSLDYFTSGNMKGGFKNFRDDLFNSMTVELNSGNNEIDEVTGEIRPSIPVTMFGNKLSAQDKSYDLARIVEAVQYQEYTLTAKREIEPLLNIYYNILQDSKSIVTKPSGDEVVIEKAPSKILDQSNYLIQSWLYNKSKEVEGVSDKKINGRNIAVSKVTDSLINYVRIKGMAFNPFSAIGNIMQGLTSNFITSVGGEYFNTSDNFKAFGTMLHSIAGRGDEAKKISKMIRKFDAFSKANELQFGTSRDIKATQNTLNNLSWFELQERGEIFIQGQTLLAMMYHYKVKVGDKTISLYEGYDSNGKWKSEYGEDPLKDKIAMYKFQQRVKSAVIDVHGNYVREIQNKKNFYWRAAMIFRTWLPQAINTRFGGETTDLLTGRTKKGRYRSYNSFIRDNDGRINLTAVYDNILVLFNKEGLGSMTEIDKINMRKNMAELALIAAITIMILGLKAALEDLDDEEKNYTTYILNSLSRTQSDLTFFMLPSSFETIIKDPIPLMGVLKDTLDLTTAGFKTITGDPVYKTGPRKGKSRVWKETLDMFPVLTQLDKNLTYASTVFEK